MSYSGTRRNSCCVNSRILGQPLAESSHNHAHKEGERERESERFFIIINIATIAPTTTADAASAADLSAPLRPSKTCMQQQQQQQLWQRQRLWWQH